MEGLPETKVDKHRIRNMDKDPTALVDINPDMRMWFSKIHALTKIRDENREKCIRIDDLMKEAHVKHRVLIADNMANFKKDFPNASRALLSQFCKATFENTILNDLKVAREKQEIVYTVSCDDLAEMCQVVNKLFPKYIPEDVQNCRTILLAFFRTCSPEDVARETSTHQALPDFKICSCEKSFNRDNLPPSYRAQVERARQFPDNSGQLISYDTPEVTEKMRNPQRRKERDVFTTTLETVWVYHSGTNSYVPHIRQQVFHKGSKDQVSGLRMRMRMRVYVEISVVDIE